MRGYDELVIEILGAMGPPPPIGNQLPLPFSSPSEFVALLHGVDIVSISIAPDASSNFSATTQSQLIIASGIGASISGSDGRDVLVGTEGNDTLNGWWDDNLLLGGLGDDTYVVPVGTGSTVHIYDVNGSDSLNIQGTIVAWNIGLDHYSLQVDNGAGLGEVRIYDHNGNGEIESINHSGGLWNPTIGNNGVVQHVTTAANNLIIAGSNLLNNLSTTVQNVNNSTILNWGFNNGNTVSFGNSFLNYSNFASRLSSLIVDIDEDLDGIVDASFTFEGDYTGKDIKLSWSGTDTILTIEDQSAPVAADDQYTTDEASRVFGNLIEDTSSGSADLDDDGDVLLVTQINDQDLVLLDTDPSQAGAQVLLASGAILEILDNGEFNYDPNGAFDFVGAGENVVDTITYQVSDQRRDGTDTATVTFTVNGLNDIPIAIDDTAAVDEDGSVVVDVLVNDSDPDANDTLVLISASSGSGATVQIQDGELVYFADADIFDLLATGEQLQDEVTYVIEDTQGARATATVSVTVTGIGDGETIEGTKKPDLLNGTDGEDLIFADRAEDVIWAGDGADTVYGGRGDDIIYGEASVDTIIGDNGDDELYGGQGNDFLQGDNGDDLIVGGVGDDQLTGGMGEDEFCFSLGDGVDQILDFDPLYDVLTFTSGILESEISISATASGTLVRYSEHDQVELIGSDPSALTKDHFLFV